MVGLEAKMEAETCVWALAWLVLLYLGCHALRNSIVSVLETFYG